MLGFSYNFTFTFKSLVIDHCCNQHDILNLQTEMMLTHHELVGIFEHLILNSP